MLRFSDNPEHEDLKSAHHPELKSSRGSPLRKDRARQALSRDVEEYLASGGRIDQLRGPAHGQNYLRCMEDVS